MENESKKIRRKRKTVKPKCCPNPLFEKWLMEWKEEAESRDSNLRYCFAKALASLRKYPVRLKSGKECLILKHFGTQLCVKLDRKLAEHKKQFPNELSPVKLCNTIEDKNIKQLDKSEVNKPKHKLTPKKQKDTTVHVPKKKLQKPYVPSWRSGPYAILLTLYEQLGLSNDNGYMLKSEIQKNAQHLCDSSFTKPDPGCRYTAWSSMSLLVKKGFVFRHGCPAKFSLTEEGKNLAEKLKMSTGSEFPSTSKVLSSSSEADIYFSSKNSPSSSPTSPRCSPLSCNTAPSYEYLSPCKSENIFSYKNKSSDTVSSSPLKSTSGSPFKLSSPCSSKFALNILDECPYNLKPKSLLLENDVIDLTDDDVPIINNDFSRHTIQPVFSSGTDSQNSVISGSSISSSSHEQLVFLPKRFDVILLVDTAETTGAHNVNTDVIVQELTDLKIRFEVRHLKVGDFVWICQDNFGNELLLPYIVERKRMDDFGKSIKDGRFHEQKFRLKQCGLENVIYLVEKYGNDSHLGLPLSTIHQAATNTQLIDKFHVKFTSGHHQSIIYLSTLTKFLINLFSEKTLFSCLKKDVSKFNINDDIASLITFKEFSRSSAKIRNFKVREMFIKQLLQLRGLSVDKVTAIVNQYPTPRRLKTAFQKSVNGDMMLSCIKYGALSRNIGPAISKSLYQLYTMPILE